MSDKTDAYPVHLSIDYEDGPRDKATAFFRVFVAFPILIILGLLPGNSVNMDPSTTLTWQMVR